MNRITAEQRILIQAAVDGELDNAGQMQLEELLATNAEAHLISEELVRVRQAVCGLTVLDLPAGLSLSLQRNMDKIATAKAGVSRTGIPTRKWLQLASRLGQRFSQPGSSSRGITMSNQEKSTFSNRKVWAAVGALAVTVAVVGYIDLGNNDDNSNLTGSIAPAQRYQTETISSNDVVLGDATIAELLQSDTFITLIQDETFVALMADARFAQLMADGRLAQLAADGRFAQLAADGRFAALAAGATTSEAMQLAMAGASVVVHQLGTTGTATIAQLARRLSV